MRVLLLTQVAPNPPDAGPKAKTHYVIRTLAQQHSVELVTFVRTDKEAAHARALRSWCESVTTIPLRRSRVKEPFYAGRSWMHAEPFLVGRDQRRSFASAVARRVDSNEIDVVHADQVTMAQYLSHSRGSRPQQVFDAHNAVWELVRGLAAKQPTPVHRVAAEIEWRLLRRFEAKACRRSDLTLTVSERDLSSLTQAAGERFPSAIIPIGVEVRDVEFDPPHRGTSDILSVATMHYPPNADAIRWYRDQIWPLIMRAESRCATKIVGPRPPQDLIDWSAADNRVSVPGYVADLDDHYRNAAVFIVPLLSGSGVRVKILDAMARGIPVVSTSIGADGLDLEPGHHLLVADTPSDFANAVVKLLGSPEQRIAMARAARQRVLELYDWRVCCSPLLDAYEQLAVPPTSVTHHVVQLPSSVAAGREDTGDR